MGNAFCYQVEERIVGYIVLKFSIEFIKAVGAVFVYAPFQERGGSKNSLI